MRCRICGEPWALDSVHEAVREEHPDLDELLVRHDSVPEGYGYVHVRRDGSWFDQPRYEREFFNPKRQEFSQRGCVALDPGARTYCVPDPETARRSATLGAIEDLMGDDVDGIESMIEDAEGMGLL
jgi:hypothetical protein